MATPGTSRSGRVLKKSVKLLEMETDYKPSPPARVSVSKMPKNSVDPAEIGLIDISPAINTHAAAINQERATPTSIALKSSSNLKFKLNLSGDIKLEQLPTGMTTELKMNNSQSNQNIIAAQNTPIKIISTPKGSIHPNAIVLKLKNDAISDSKNNAKRTIETTNLTLESLKKLKVEPELNKTNQPIIISSALVKQTKVELPKKIIVSQTSTKPDSEQSQQPFKAIISPINQVDKDTKAKVQQSFASSTPKINTIFSSNILARSIQEQKRINQRARLLAQQATPAPAPTISRVSQSAKITPSVTSSQTSARTNTKESSTADDDKKSSKKVSVSPYVLWCREARSEYQSRYPDLDFVNLSKKMGEIWHTLAQNEKDIWFKKAKQLTLSTATESAYTQDWISDDLKPKTVSSKQTLPITTETLEMFDENFVNGDKEGIISTEVHSIGTELIDVHAYLNILGDSLETIGSYIQRGVKYNSHIDYSQSTALSTLLDTALVAIGSITCLTRAIPQLAPSAENMARTIEDITYFMPPADLAYDA